MNGRAVILPGVDSQEFAKEVVQQMQRQYYPGIEKTPTPEIINLIMEVFADGEFAPVIQRTVRDRRVFIMQHTRTPEDVVKLCMTIDAVKRCSGEKAVVVMPYMPFSRQDKTMDKRTSLGAKVVANMLKACGADHVITFDLHAPQIAGFFDGIPVDNIHGHVIFGDFLKENAAGLDWANVTWISPDAGGTKRTQKFRALFPGSGFGVIDKAREAANKISHMELIGDVEGRDCVLTDDMADTFTTIAKASDLLMKKGAKSVRAILTHALMSGDAFTKLRNSSLTQLLVSDSIPLKETDPRITVVSLAPALAKVMLQLTSSKSLSEFNH